MFGHPNSSESGHSYSPIMWKLFFPSLWAFLFPKNVEILFSLFMGILLPQECGNPFFPFYGHPYSPIMWEFFFPSLWEFLFLSLWASLFPRHLGIPYLPFMWTCYSLVFGHPWIPQELGIPQYLGIFVPCYSLVFGQGEGTPRAWSAPTTGTDYPLCTNTFSQDFPPNNNPRAGWGFAQLPWWNSHGSGSFFQPWSGSVLPPCGTGMEREPKNLVGMVVGKTKADIPRCWSFTWIILKKKTTTKTLKNKERKWRLVPVCFGLSC